MRHHRQRAILQIVDTRPIHSQAELVRALRKRGLSATQATVSRDLRELGLVKVPVEGGGARYARPGSMASSDSPAARLRGLASSVVELDQGQALLLLKTLSGHANAVAVALDGCRLPEVAGTLAGDDTVLVVLRTERDRPRIRRKLEELLG